MPVVPAVATSLTVGTLIDRVLRDHIRPAAEQPIVCFPSAAALATDETVTLDTTGLTLPEQDAVSPGVVIELGTELAFVKSASTNSGITTVTLVRGWQGTTPQALTTNTIVTVSPDITRAAIFDAIADEIQSLWPKLWAIGTTSLTTGTSPVEIPAAADTIESFQFQDRNGNTHTGQARIVRNAPDVATGTAVQFVDVPSGVSGQLTYRSRFEAPESEATSFDELGVQPDWIAAIVFGAAARVVVTMDPRSLSVEWATEADQAAVSPPGTPTALASRLKRLRDEEVEAAARRWRVIHKTRMTVTDPYRPWGGAR